MNTTIVSDRDASTGSDIETHGIRVIVEPRYSGDRVDNYVRKHIFEYHITIQNLGEEPARLRSRHWVIVDANGQLVEVRGGGVVGQFPRLEPGQSHSYVSECPLSTPWGTMEGTYEFERDGGGRFSAKIARFYLALRTQ